MPKVRYALIPDGYTLKKVNKGELEAVNNHNRAQAIRRFTGSQNSSVILLVAIAVGLYFLAKQIKLPNFDILGSFAAGFPQLSAALGVKRELTAEQAQTLRDLLEKGAPADAPGLTRAIFPTPEEKAARKEASESVLGF